MHFFARTIDFLQILQYILLEDFLKLRISMNVYIKIKNEDYEESTNF